MAVAKITTRTVESVPPGGFIWDTVLKGFGVRRQTTEDVFYIIRYRFPGRPQVFLSIGRHGGVTRNGVSLTPDTARTEAKRLLGMVADGINPSDERKGEREKLRELGEVETFKPVAERYLAKRKLAMKPRAYLEVERHLLKHAEPLHRRRITEINRLAIVQLLELIEEGSGPSARNRVRSSLSAFFNWAIKEHHVEANPVANTNKASEIRARDRVLTDAELAEVWAALPHDHFGDIVRLLILTAQRREEIGSLRWSEVDLAKGLIVLPPERTKNNRSHWVPLSPPAKAILERQLRRNDREFIFGIGKGGFSGWSDCKARLDQAIAAAGGSPNLPTGRRGKHSAGMAPWRLHDLRRTAVTGMNELGVLPHVVETVVNHVSGHRGGIAGVYNLARHEGETRAALEKWGGHVEAITQTYSNGSARS
jgi:integrase